MYQFVGVDTKESGKQLEVIFHFESNDARLKPKAVSVTLSSAMNMFDVGMHLNKTAAIILGHHEESDKILKTR